MKKKNNNTCSFENCKNNIVARGYCKKHYYELRRKGLIEDFPKCKVENCTNKTYIKGFCCKHYSQIYNNGEILTNTIYENNEIILNNEYAEIVLYKENKEYCRTKIDLDDVEKVKNIRWSLSEHGYAKSGTETLYLHRFLLNIEDSNIVVDHISGDILDNRKINLRICSQHENSMNQGNKRALTSYSGIKGVRYNEMYEQWEARIGYNYQTISLGLFDNIEDAIIAREKGAKMYFKEFTRKDTP